jgi:hypothetical protein
MNYIYLLKVEKKWQQDDDINEIVIIKYLQQSTLWVN